jgi:hypothetical protein
MQRGGCVRIDVMEDADEGAMDAVIKAVGRVSMTEPSMIVDEAEAIAQNLTAPERLLSDEPLFRYHETRQGQASSVSNSHFDFRRSVASSHHRRHSGRGRGVAGSWWDWRRLRKSEREQQIVPGWKNQVGRDRCQLVEEIVARAKLGPCVAPELVANIADGMHGEGQ